MCGTDLGNGIYDDSIDMETKILNAAIQEFTWKSISKTTMLDIANRADIGKGTLYLYFSSKNVLIRQAFGYLSFGKNVNMKPIEATAEYDPWGALDAYLDEIVTQVKEKPERALLLNEFASELLIRQKKDKDIMLMRKLYQNAIDPELHLIKVIIQKGRLQGVFKPIGIADDTLAFLIAQLATSLSKAFLIDNDEGRLDDLVPYVKKAISALLGD